MRNLRLFLVFGLIFSGLLLIQAWQQDYAAPTPPRADAEQLPGTIDPPDADAPPELEAVPDLPDEQPQIPETVRASDVPTVLVRTDVMELVLSLEGGALIEARLLDYPIDPELPDQPVELLTSFGQGSAVMRSGLIGRDVELPDHRALFAADQAEYQLESETLEVPLRWASSDGSVEVDKILRFQRGAYAIEVEQRIRNRRDETLQIAQYRQIKRSPQILDAGFNDPARYSFNGAALYTPAEKYEKLDFGKLDKGSVERTANDGWIAFVQHYFLLAWIPPQSETNVLSAQPLSSGRNEYLIQAVSSPDLVSVPAAGEASLVSTAFVGPKLQDQLDPLAPGLELTVDYGWLTPASKILFWLLDKIHDFVGNWGWSIVILTILVKLVFYKLSEAQYRSMARMRKLQPRIEALKERYKDDNQARSQAMMKLFQEHKVNPLGGCLPLLVQIPVFLALYWVLLESVELRQAPFMLWIKDLSSPDPYFILPAINGAAMFMTAKLSPTPTADPIQQRIMLFMPIAFAVMFAFFQAGLVLYWTANSVLSLLQQYVIIKRVEASETS